MQTKEEMTSKEEAFVTVKPEPPVASKSAAKRVEATKNIAEPVEPAEPAEELHHNPHLASVKTQATRRGLN